MFVVTNFKMDNESALRYLHIDNNNYLHLHRCTYNWIASTPHFNISISTDYTICILKPLKVLICTVLFKKFGNLIYKSWKEERIGSPGRRVWSMYWQHWRRYCDHPGPRHSSCVKSNLQRMDTFPLGRKGQKIRFYSTLIVSTRIHLPILYIFVWDITVSKA